MINARRTLKVKDFLENKIILHCPSENDIYTACDNLRATGNIEITCSLASLSPVMQSLEIAGFFGFFIIPQQELTRSVKIVAYKGKDNPCYDTGKSACYRGSAFAAVDDDHHLLFEETRVCEKTAIIYDLPIYKKIVKTTKGDPELIARLKTDPAPFDCDTFESDATRLANTLTDSETHKELTSVVLYPGPFKILIMNDGTMIRRGVPLRISDSAAHALMKSDAGILLKGNLAANAEDPLNFQNAYKKQGTLCLVETPKINAQFDTADTADLRVLEETPSEMKQRLLKLIESNSEYFIITGSDARDFNGCCPSDGVKAANHLVEAGVMQVARTNSAPDSCPVNIYAFSGEIKARGMKPEFKINQEFRQKIKNYINNKKSSQKFSLDLVRWSLLLFVAISLAVFASNILQKNGVTTEFTNFDLVKEFDLPFQNGVLILQFHLTQRCNFCNDMENHTKEALNIYFPDDLQNGNIAFRMIDMEFPRYESLRKKYNLFTSTLVFVDVRRRKESRWKIITKAWHLTDKKQKFIEMFRSELIEFREGRK
jgi:hypothetical protein